MNDSPSFKGVSYPQHNFESAYTTLLEIKELLEILSGIKSPGKRAAFYDELRDAINNINVSLGDKISYSDTEFLQDTIGAMVSGNIETGITVTYDDVGNKLNFSVPNELVGLVGVPYTDLNSVPAGFQQWVAATPYTHGPWAGLGAVGIQTMRASNVRGAQLAFDESTSMGGTDNVRVSVREIGGDGVWSNWVPFVTGLSAPNPTAGDLAMWTASGGPRTITSVSYGSVKASLSLTKADVGLGNVDNTSDATKFTSPTITGTPVVSNGASSSYLVLRANAGTNRAIQIQTGTLLRWLFGGTNDAESGANAGTNFGLYRYADDGSYLGQSMFINRSTGTVTFGNAVSIVGALDVTGAITEGGVGKVPKITSVDNRAARFDGTGGLIQLANLVIEDPVTLAINTATTFAAIAGGNNEVCIICANGGANPMPNALFRWRSGDPSCVSLSPALANVVFDTGVQLTGTTGTAGNFTIRCRTTGSTLDMENRTGGSVTFTLIRIKCN